jgi:leucyl aminopeptidase (aminopeptidase T)
MYRNPVTIALCLWGAVAFAAPPSSEAIAKRLVESANITPGDVVRVSGGVSDIGLLTSIAVEVQKAGGTSFFDVTSDQSIRRICHEVPPERDADNAAAALKLVAVQTADISVPTMTNPGLCGDVAPARMAARNKAFQGVGEAFNRAGIKAVNLGNGMDPTDWRAKRFGISREQLAALYWNGISVDPEKLKAAADPVVRGLAGKQLTISAANGTKLTMSIEGRPVLFSDGRITPSTEKKGQTITAWLPAGDVYLAVVPGTAEGTVTVDRTWFQNKPIDGLTLTVKGGKVVSMTAKSGAFEQFKAAYDGAGGAKDAVGVVNIGVNPNLRAPAGSKVNGTPVWGVVTVITGDTSWAGGSDVSSWGFLGAVPQASVAVDGKTLVDKGQLKSPDA